MIINDAYAPIKLLPEQRSSVEKFQTVSELVVISSITTGRSGASVYTVDVQPVQKDGPRGRFILKIDRRSQASKERDNHAAAFITKIQPHMAQMVESTPPNEDWIATLYSLAHSSQIDSIPLYELCERNFIQAVEEVKQITTILHTWNSQVHVQHDHPFSYLSKALGTLMRGGKGIPTIAEKSLGVTIENDALLFQGCPSILPNPIAYASKKELWGNLQAIAWPSGHSHGDLHSANILCPLVRDGKNTIIIDFAQYRPDYLIFYDLAYLEFDLLLHLLPPLSDGDRESWIKVGENLALEMNLPYALPGGPLVQAVRDVIQPIRNLIQQYSEQEKQTDDFPLAYTLTKVAIGLNYFRKTQEDENMQGLALLYAAQNLQAFFNRLEKTFPSRKIANVAWVGNNGAIFDTRTQEKIEILRGEILSALRDERRVILFLGPEFYQWLGFPTEKDIAQKLGLNRTNQKALPLDVNDPANLNNILRDHPNIDDLRLQIAQAFVSKTLNDRIIQAQSLASVRWQAVVDWSYTTTFQRQYQELIIDGQKVTPINSLSDVNQINVGHTYNLYWIYLRGTVEETQSIVLGNRGWREQKHRQYREEAVNRLFRTGPQDQRTMAIFLGSKGDVLNELFNLAQSAFHNGLITWAISKDINNDVLAQKLTGEGLNCVDLSPDLFCSFLNREMPFYGERKSLNERYIMDIAGIELDVQDYDVVSPGSVRRTLDSSDEIVELPVPVEKFALLSEYLEILYRNVEIDSFPKGKVVGDFYRGHPITWKEIALGYDADRIYTDEILENVLLPDLKEQSPKRIMLSGEPGAGTTTIAYRLAWNIYQVNHIPVALIRRADPSLTHLLDAVTQFRDLVQRSFLLVAEEEYIHRDDADVLFEKMQSKLAPIIMMFVSQTEKADEFKVMEKGKRKRSFSIKDRLEKWEPARLRQKIAPYIDPLRLKEVEALDDNSLFVNLIAAFETEFVRLKPMVYRLLKKASKEAKELLAAIAYCNRYGHQPAPLSLLATILGYKREQVIEFLSPFTERLIFLQKDQFNEPSYRYRHELIGTQILRELWGSKEDPDTWVLQLPERTLHYLDQMGSDKPGNEWQREFVARLIVGEFTTIMIRTRPDYRASRLMSEIREAVSRGLVFKKAMERFPDEPHFIAQYGRFLYDEDTRFEESRQYLHTAFEMTNDHDSRICHMLGMSYRRELREYLQANPRLRSVEFMEKCDHLLKNAGEYFERARILDRENEYGYASHIECLIDLIRHGFRQFNQDIPNSKRLAGRPDLQAWLAAAFSILDEARVYTTFNVRTHLGQLEIELKDLQGDLDLAITVYQQMLDRSRSTPGYIDPIPVKRNLARCFYDRALQRRNDQNENNRIRALEDFDRASKYLDELIHDQPQNPSHLGLWFQCMRANPDIDKSLLTQKLEIYYAKTQGLEAAFYLMCVYFARGLEETNPSAFREYERYQGICKNLSANLTHRLHRREWIGPGYTLIPNWSIPFDLSREEPITEGLPRVKGVIKRIKSDTHGDISIPPYGQIIFFQPRRRDKQFYVSDVEREVDFNVAFTYDGPTAYDPDYIIK